MIITTFNDFFLHYIFLCFFLCVCFFLCLQILHIQICGPGLDKENEKKLATTNMNNEKASEIITKVQEDLKDLKKVDDFLSPEEKSKSAYKTAKRHHQPIKVDDDKTLQKQQEPNENESPKTMITNKFPKSKKIGQPKPYNEQIKTATGKETGTKQDDQIKISKETSKKMQEMSKKQSPKSDKTKTMELKKNNPDAKLLMVTKEPCKE